MAEKIGVVEAVKQREKGYSILMDDGNWYSGFGKCPVGKEDKVKFEWEQNGQWLNIKGNKVEKVSDKETQKEIQEFRTADKAPSSELEMRLMAFDKAVGWVSEHYLEDEEKNMEKIRELTEKFVKIIGGYS